MNKFEHDVQSKNNDVADSAIGFLTMFGCLATIYIIAQVFQIVAG
ncbi:YqzM family protein [Abyssicoccus albus]|uniref:YqzM-like protein n=1 Tax=Abyssicoccus albus TaxID=1817405 RepID=A0A1Q1G121_9BACL|nr:YqzM family protein [Abyssicoccus albus]AQL56041.1 hypothetical protein BVH56_03445 [Abyssicoccus albus]RPF58152.1 YqzM-like protein [Abyssicoccus albus]